MAADTLGHLLARKMTAVNEPERARVAELTARIQDEVTRGQKEDEDRRRQQEVLDEDERRRQDEASDWMTPSAGHGPPL